MITTKLSRNDRHFDERRKEDGRTTMIDRQKSKEKKKKNRNKKTTRIVPPDIYSGFLHSFPADEISSLFKKKMSLFWAILQGYFHYDNEQRFPYL
mmetsp:Transcript_22343/g.22679  ORF Transcript_22343/g.22679 Transcript_22343/m.22679 type:complete len:95 (-) Transcript_22343:6-290(-)